MRKLKLAVALPAVQAIVAATLLYMAGPLRGPPVPTARLICVGLNAPAMFFSFVGVDTIFGIDASDLFFLLGIIVVWYFVGRALDRRRVPRTIRESTMVRAVTHSFLLAMGGLLLYIGLLNFRYPIFENLGRRPERGILTLSWSCCLIFFSGKALLRMIHVRPTTKPAADR
jgi:hypothetical protein